MATIKLEGEAQKRADVGNEIINQFFEETNLRETMQKLNDTAAILKFIQSKKYSNITDAIEIFEHAGSYAANVKDWKAT